MRNKWRNQATELDIKVRNQLKVTWRNQCKKIDEMGILCSDKPWEHCEQKALSPLYLCIRTESLKICEGKHPHFIIEKDSIKDLWRVMEDTFIKTRKITYDHFVFFSSQQQKGESVESFYESLVEQSGN